MLIHLSHEKRVDVLFGYFYHSKYTIAIEVGLHHDRVELYARSLVQRNVLMRIGEQSCGTVDAKYLYDIAVSTCAQQESTVGGDIEMAWMYACVLIAYLGQQPCAVSNL